MGYKPVRQSGARGNRKMVRFHHGFDPVSRGEILHLMEITNRLVVQLIIIALPVVSRDTRANK